VRKDLCFLADGADSGRKLSLDSPFLVAGVRGVKHGHAQGPSSRCICWHDFRLHYSLKAFGRIHSVPATHPSHANTLARQFAESANTLPNAKRRRARSPKQKPWAIHSPSVPGACQHATSVEAAAEAHCQALPLHPPLLPRAFASVGQLPLLKDHRRPLSY
jgi:hypothetical protein